MPKGTLRYSTHAERIGTVGPLIVDIETVGLFDMLPDPVQQYLLEREERRQEAAEDPADPAEVVRDTLALNPAAGTIVSIGMWAPHHETGAVLVNNENGDKPTSANFERYDAQTAVYYGNEGQILQAFWDKVAEKAGPGGRQAPYPVVTFNGRGFDGPYLMLRSAIHGVKPSRNLVGYRYSFREHCDLQEVLTFHGALGWQHHYSLDFWCGLFDIPSPKEDMDGSQVDEVWKNRDYDRLIQYSLADVKATAQLFNKTRHLIDTMY